MKLVNMPAHAALAGQVFGFLDHFDREDTNRWTTIATDAGASTLQDAANGVMLLEPSDGTVADNDETYLHTTKELFLFADDAPIYGAARIKFTEANTDDANMLLGVMNAPAANHLLDNGGGPAADYSGVVFFKVDGGTVWQVENSIGTTQKTTELTAANSLTGDDQTAGGGTFELLEFLWQPKTSTKADISFWRNKVLVAKHTDQSYASATEMAVILGVKNGGANHDKLHVDFVSVWQAIP
jgi:hypothetical protein